MLQPKGQELARVVLWGSLLACSWTWCIGMYLPVLLIRDYGPLSYLLFILPNVIGASFMGIRLFKDGASAAYVSAHHTACRAFSVVTMGFQVFFALWLLNTYGGTIAERVAGFALFLAPYMLMNPSRANVALTAGAAVAVYSIATTLFATSLGATPPPPHSRVTFDAAGLSGLGLVCALGFLACPQLDLTFHAVRQRLAGAPGNAAFAIGLGAIFPLLVLATFFYAPAILHHPSGQSAMPGLAPKFVLAHMLLQLGLTTGLHAWALRREASVRGEVLVTAALALGAVLWVIPMPSYARLSGEELVYRGVMVFYGLIFPAYILTCARPLTQDQHAPGRRSLLLCGLTIAAAVPFFWLGFIERRSGWLIVGVGIVAAAGAVAGRWKPALPVARPGLSP